MKVVLSVQCCPAENPEVKVEVGQWFYTWMARVR